MPKAQVNGTEIYYKVVGDGPPCLIMHGGLGVDHTVLHPYLDPLSEHFQLIYYDHRGNGQSAEIEKNTLTHEALIEDVSALADYLGFEKFAIAGHSYGGFIAMEYALQYPDRVNELLLINTAPVFDYFEEIMENAVRKNATEEMLEAIAAEAQTDEEYKSHLITFYPLYFKVYDSVIHDPIIEKSIVKISGVTKEGELANYTVVDRLGEINAPSIILVGRDDFITPPSKSEILHEGLPDSRLHIFEDSGHFPFVEEGDKFFSVVKDWVSSL